MANTSIKNAFQRMWQHVVAALKAENITYNDTNTALGVDSVQEAIEYLTENGGNAKDIAVPLLLNNWVLDSTDNTYSYTATVNGLTSNSTPIVMLSSVGDEATEDELDSYACISDIVTSNGSIKFIASEKPSISFTVIVKNVVASEGDATAVVTELVGKVSELETDIDELNTNITELNSDLSTKQPKLAKKDVTYSNMSIATKGDGASYWGNLGTVSDALGSKKTIIGLYIKDVSNVNGCISVSCDGTTIRGISDQQNIGGTVKVTIVYVE